MTNEYLSTVTRPVTQVDDVAVNRQSSRGVTSRSLDDMGRDRSSVPMMIITKKLSEITWV